VSDTGSSEPLVKFYNSLKHNIFKLNHFFIFQLYDLSYFMVILMVFVTSYAIASYSILYPNSSLTADVLIKVMRMSYWNLYGELFIDEIECKSIFVLLSVYL